MGDIADQMEALHGHMLGSSEDDWLMANGTSICINDMETSHIKNCLNLSWIGDRHRQLMEEELEKRENTTTEI